MANGNIIDIGDRIEMFIDDFLVFKMDGAAFRLHPPERREIAVKFEETWEGAGSAPGTVFHDGEKYRMYYRGWGCGADIGVNDGSELQFTCYAESKDGINWTKKTIGKVEYQGSVQNNIIRSGIYSHNFAAGMDTNPECPKDEIFKAVAGQYSTKIHIFKSADGVSWEEMQDGPVITDGAFDTLNTWFYDSVNECYRCYTRYWEKQEGDDPGNDFGGIRAIQSSTSKDFRNWTGPVPNTYPKDAPWEHFYTNAAIPCPGAPHYILSFPFRFVPDRHKVREHQWPGVSDSVFLTSRDGVNFERTFMDPWIVPDLNPRSWTQRCHQTAQGILETSPEEFSLYVHEHYTWDDARIRRYALRRHGFGSVHADYKGGSLVTKPFIFDGDKLFINYATSAPGSVRVGIFEEKADISLNGYGIDDCDIIYGNELEKEVTWNEKGCLAGFRGKPVRLKFELKDADLFAICFKQGKLYKKAGD